MIIDKTNSYEVAVWADALVKAGYPGKMNLDIIKRALAGEKFSDLYGPKTKAATEAFQAAMGLSQTGEVDGPTARAMWGAANKIEIKNLGFEISMLHQKLDNIEAEAKY